LCAQVDDEDWLIRYNAGRSLLRSATNEAMECLESLLDDSNFVVRSLAIQGVSRRDPKRAIALYESLLHEPDVTPLLRQRAERAIGELRAGRDVRDPLDPI
jgi:HEAT repeat protein